MLQGILTIAGQPGLYKMVAQMKQGLLVEELETGKRTPVYGSSRVSALDDIAMFTETDDVPLRKVFAAAARAMKFQPTLVGKKSSDEELRTFMASVLPDFDRERVRVADIKKLAVWYNQLLAKSVITMDSVGAVEVE